MGGWGLYKKDLNEISPSGEPRTAQKKGEKIKEGGVKNTITINPNVQVEEIKTEDKEAYHSMSTKEFNKTHRDFKSGSKKKGNARVTKGVTNPSGTTTPSSRRVKFTDEYELRLENPLINKIKNDFNLIKKAKEVVGNYNSKLKKNAAEINKVMPGSASVTEDAKMARQSDDALSAAHKKFSSMDQTSPANKFMLKRISKEMNRRKKKVSEELNRNQKPFYQKKYSTDGYKTVGKNKRMNSSSDRKKAGTVDSKASHRDQMKDFADAGIIKKGKSGGGLKKGLASLKKESLLDQVAGAFVDEATRMKKEMGYDKGGTKKPKGPKAKDAALDAIKAKYKGQIMRSGSNQPKKVKGAKPSGGGKFKMMADKKKETAADAKKRGFKNTKDYVNTMARYGGKDNYDKGKGLGT